MCLEEGDEGGYPLKADHRPDWALLGKVNANMETTAFKEKFIDWPDSSRLIKVKEPNDNGKVCRCDTFISYMFLSMDVVFQDIKKTQMYRQLHLAIPLSSGAMFSDRVISEACCRKVDLFSQTMKSE